MVALKQRLMQTAPSTTQGVLICYSCQMPATSCVIAHRCADVSCDGAHARQTTAVSGSLLPQQGVMLSHLRCCLQCLLLLVELLLQRLYLSGELLLCCLRLLCRLIALSGQALRQCLHLRGQLLQQRCSCRCQVDLQRPSMALHGSGRCVFCWLLSLVLWGIGVGWEWGWRASSCLVVLGCKGAFVKGKCRQRWHTRLQHLIARKTGSRLRP